MILMFLMIIILKNCIIIFDHEFAQFLIYSKTFLLKEFFIYSILFAQKVFYLFNFICLRNFHLLKELFFYSVVHIFKEQGKNLLLNIFILIVYFTFKCFNCLVRQNCFEASTINFKVFEIKLNKRIKSVLPNLYYAKSNH